MRFFARAAGALLIGAGVLEAAESAPPPEVQQVERGLRPAVLLKGDKTWTIEERMRLHKVPAVSIAVFGSGKILWAKAYGSADADALTAATDATLFQAASISKPVSAMAALKLAELLSHSGGVTVHGFPGYAAGRAVPTLVQVLDGAPPANTPAIRVDTAPGKEFRYSGGGHTIVQQALI